MTPNEQKVLNIFRNYTPKIIESIRDAIKDENVSGSGFDRKVFAYFTLKHRTHTYIGYAFEDIAAEFGEKMINLNLDDKGNRIGARSGRVKGVDLENDKYCIQLKSSPISENGTGKRGYDTALINASNDRNKKPVLAIAICDKPKKRRITHGITYAEGKDFWENYVELPYNTLLDAKYAYEKELQMLVDNLLNETN